MIKPNKKSDLRIMARGKKSALQTLAKGFAEDAIKKIRAGIQEAIKESDYAQGLAYDMAAIIRQQISIEIDELGITLDLDGYDFDLRCWRNDKVAYGDNGPTVWVPGNNADRHLLVEEIKAAIDKTHVDDDQLIHWQSLANACKECARLLDERVAAERAAEAKPN